MAHVTYLTGGLVYLDAGREDGLEVGKELRVEREGGRRRNDQGRARRLPPSVVLHRR